MPTFRGAGATRRDFLRAGALTAGLSIADLATLRAAGRGDVNCILLFLVGGPSHLDTWDPKPDAPAHIRGPFKPIRTNVAGIQICEHFPRMARRMDRVALVRSVHHDAAPIHETGQQMMQTGRLFRGDEEYPHYGSVISHLRGPGRQGLPPFVMTPGPIGNTGINVSHGQGAGFLGTRHEPFLPSAVEAARIHGRRELVDAEAADFLLAQRTQRAFDVAAETEDARERYGRNTFGQSCLLARRLVEHGVRFVTVNMFDTVFDRLTWDCHADGGVLGTTLDDYKQTLCPMFDLAYTALLDDLEQRGMLGNTLVLALGEFGRTPILNARGGRDHWPGAWTVLFAGGGVRGGQVVGATDRFGAEPRDYPVTPAQVAATVYRGLGIDPKTRLPGAMGPLVDAEPIPLFRG